MAVGPGPQPGIVGARGDGGSARYLGVPEGRERAGGLVPGENGLDVGVIADRVIEDLDAMPPGQAEYVSDALRLEGFGQRHISFLSGHGNHRLG